MNTAANPIEVWIVEDNREYREGLLRVIGKIADIRCVGTFAHCEEALATISQDENWRYPDVVLMDIMFNQPGRNDHMSGIEAITHLKTRLPDVPIVMLTGYDATKFIFDAFKNGASGYLHKKARMKDITDAIRMAHRGGMLTPPSVAAKMLNFFKQTDSNPELQLSDRELEVVKAMGEGKKRKEIAEALFISVNTVDTHLSNIYRKLHVKNGMQAVAKVYGSHLIEERFSEKSN